jgi:hypothetical protein
MRGGAADGLSPLVLGHLGAPLRVLRGGQEKDRLDPPRQASLSGGESEPALPNRGDARPGTVNTRKRNRFGPGA